jgi:hypothetical protein
MGDYEEKLYDIGNDEDDDEDDASQDEDTS